MSKKPWEPQLTRMCSMTSDVEGVKKHFAECLDYYNATEELDAQLTDMEAAQPWEHGVKCHWKMLIKTYRGWKVYTLMTGALASLCEYEPLER